MKEYAVYWGCMIPHRLPSIEIAARYVLEKLGVRVREVENYTCCPDPIIGRFIDRKTALTLSARNLALAEELGPELLVLCNGCFETLIEAAEALHDENTQAEINQILEKVGRKYRGAIQVRHVVEVLHDDVGLDRIKEVVQKPSRVKLAVHYGCHLFREPDGEDIWRKPKQFEELLRVIGGNPVLCDHNRLCCGFPTSHVDPEYSLRMNLLPKMRCYKQLKIEAVVTVCPACTIQMETGQRMLRKFGLEISVPIVHLMELMALAFGMRPQELSLKVHRSPVEDFARRVFG